MKANKYNYLKVIQQHFGQGWEDVSEYSTNSNGECIGDDAKSGKFKTLKSGRTIEFTLLAHDLAEYQLTGYATRVITRKELNTTNSK